MKSSEDKSNKRKRASLAPIPNGAVPAKPVPQKLAKTNEESKIDERVSVSAIQKPQIHMIPITPESL